MTNYYRSIHRPDHGESLSSWLNRGSMKNDNRCKKVFGYLCNNGVEDIDGLGEMHVPVIASILDVEPKLLKMLCIPESTGRLAVHQRRSYCEQCLITDISKGRYPRISLSWLYQWVSVCEIHGTPLSTTKPPNNETTLIGSALGDIFSSDHSPPDIRSTRELSPASGGYTLLKKIKTGRDVMIALSYIFQVWMSKVMISGSGVIGRNVEISSKDMLELVDLFGRVAFRKAQRNSAFTSPTLFYLRPQYRPKLRYDEIGSMENILSNEIGDIPAGDRIGYFAMLGALLDIGVHKNILKHFMRNLWSGGYQWEMPRDLLDDETHDFRAWIKSSMKSKNTNVIYLVDELLRDGASIGLSSPRS